MTSPARSRKPPAGASPSGRGGSDHPVLEIHHLRVVHPGPSAGRRTTDGVVAVDDVTLTVGPGEVVALIGESGSGKSTLAMAAAGLGPVTAGTIKVLGRDITDMPTRERRRRSADVQVVFQDPVASLDPRQRIRRGFAELRKLHPDRTAGTTDTEILGRVGLSPEVLDRYPTQMSGGQAQRVVIARALLLKPKLVLADEPTSALDVSVQAQVLTLLLELASNDGISILLVTHDLSIVRHSAAHVYVMRSGAIVEQGETEPVLTRPQHDYTKRLIEALPGKNFAPSWRIHPTTKGHDTTNHGRKYDV